MKFVGNLHCNIPQVLDKEIVMGENNRAFASVTSNPSSNPFPKKDYTIKLNVINKSFIDTPVSHLMALEIIFLHEYLAHILPFSDNVREFSEGFMRFMPYKYYRDHFNYKRGVWEAFNSINDKYFRPSKNPQDSNPIKGYKLSEDICGQFINRNNFFKLICLMTFGFFDNNKLIEKRHYDEKLIEVISELRRILDLKDGNNLLEEEIKRSPDLNEFSVKLNKIK